MLPTKKYSLIILAGGKSSRMGFNKAYAKLGDKTFISIIIHTFSPLADEVIISGKKEEFKDLPYPIISDENPDCGPIGGIQTCLKAAKNETCIVMACDTPFVPKKLIREMLQQDFKDCIVATKDGQIHPLIAIYRKSCLPKINKAIKKKEFALYRVLEKLNVQYFDITNNPTFGGKGLFRNINNFAELEELKTELNKE